MDDEQIPEREAELVAHERTYKAFNLLLRWSMVATASAILSLTLWFAGPAGWFGGIATGVLAFVLGYVFLIRDEERKPVEDFSPFH